MTILTFDIEATGAQRNKANPFDARNRMCSLGYKLVGHGVNNAKIEYDFEEPYVTYLNNFQKALNESTLVVGFNLKFDLHWIRRYGIKWDKLRVWDCQLFHFIQSNQKERFPSLNDCLSFHHLPTKLDVIRTEYWDVGLDTDQIPWNILDEYGRQDVNVTELLFQKQYEIFQQLPTNRKNLILLHMRDLLVLEEMEYNGSLYDRELSLKMGADLEKKIGEIDEYLKSLAPGIPVSFNSDQQLSAFLYGGIINDTREEEYEFVYKNPKKAPVIKIRKVPVEYKLHPIFAPLKGTEMAKPGIYSVAAPVLKTLQQRATGFKKKVLDTLLLRAKLEKQKATYCFGTPKLIGTMGWEDNILHGQLNQCTVITGRLSCEKPNLQNQDGKMKICFISRFK